MKRPCPFKIVSKANEANEKKRRAMAENQSKVTNLTHTDDTKANKKKDEMNYFKEVYSKLSSIYMQTTFHFYDFEFSAQTRLYDTY